MLLLIKTLGRVGGLLCLTLATLSALTGCRPNAQWSPTGDLLSVEGPTGISVVDPEDRSRRVLVTHGRPFSHAWSPDGQTIAFYRLDPEGRLSLRAIHPRNAEPRDWPLTAFGSIRVPDVSHALIRSVVSMSWRPDGGALACVGRLGSREVLQVLDLAGGKVRTIGKHGTSLLAPCWSPDGTSLAFVAVSPNLATPQAPRATSVRHTWVGIVRLSTGKMSRLWQSVPGTRVLPWSDGPYWSRDGRTVSFLTYRSSPRRDQQSIGAGNGLLLTVGVRDGRTAARVGFRGFPDTAAIGPEDLGVVFLQGPSLLQPPRLATDRGPWKGPRGSPLGLDRSQPFSLAELDGIPVPRVSPSANRSVAVPFVTGSRGIVAVLRSANGKAQRPLLLSLD